MKIAESEEVVQKILKGFLPETLYDLLTAYVKPKTSIILASFIAAVCCAACTNDPKAAEEACKASSWRAAEAVKNGDYATSETLYLQALEQAKQSNNAMQRPRILQGMADLYIKEDKLSRADESLRQELENYNTIEKGFRLTATDRADMLEGRVLCLETLTGVLEKQGKLEEASQICTQAVTLNKTAGGSVEDTIRISKKFASLLKSMHKDDQADSIQVDVESSNLMSPEVEAGLNTGLKLVLDDFDPVQSVSKLKSWTLASERLQKYDRLQQSLFYLGLAEARCGRIDQAEAAFRKCISILKPGKIGGVELAYEKNMALELTGVACCLEIQGKTKDANDLYKRAMNYNMGCTTAMIFYVARSTILSGRTDYAKLLSQRLVLLADETKQNRDDQVNVANAINMLANVLRTQGKWAEAIPLAKECLRIFERTEGPNTQVVASVLNSLGCDYRAVGRFSEAESILKRQLSICERDQSREPKSYAIALESLAENYRLRQQYAAAEPLFIRSRMFYEKVEGQNGTDAIRALGLLAANYRCAGKYAESVPLYKKAIDIYDKTKRKESVEVAGVLFDLAESYRSLKQCVEAEPLMKRAMAIYEVRFPGSIVVGQLLFAEAENDRCLKRYEEALPLYKQALTILEKTKGMKAYDLAAVLRGWGNTLRALGRFAEAEPLYRRALSIVSETAGDDSLDAAFTYFNMADNFQDQGKYQDAETARKHALDLYKKRKGAYAPEVAKTLAKLGENYDLQGNKTEAQQLYKQALAIYRKDKGEHSAEVAELLRKLAEPHH